MKTFIEMYLLAKSALGATITHLDSLIAFAVQEDDPNPPEWLSVIANMEQPGPMPEAWAHFCAEIEAAVDLLEAKIERWLE